MFMFDIYSTDTLTNEYDIYFHKYAERDLIIRLMKLISKIFMWNLLWKVMNDKKILS